MAIGSWYLIPAAKDFLPSIIRLYLKARLLHLSAPGFSFRITAFYKNGSILFLWPLASEYPEPCIEYRSPQASFLFISFLTSHLSLLTPNKKPRSPEWKARLFYDED